MPLLGPPEVGERDGSPAAPTVGIGGQRELVRRACVRLAEAESDLLRDSMADAGDRGHRLDQLLESRAAVESNCIGRNGLGERTDCAGACSP
jgi:hypothetical protein